MLYFLYRLKYLMDLNIRLAIHKLINKEAVEVKPNYKDNKVEKDYIIKITLDEKQANKINKLLEKRDKK
jgi:hypothetical protein